MKNLMKKLFMLTSVLGVAVIMAACSSCDSRKSSSKADGMEYYRTHEDADVKKVSAKMYTRSSSGGQSKMGHIKFYETDSGLKMEVDLKDMRPGVEYDVVVYGKSMCNNMDKSCQKQKMPLELPMLRAGKDGKLEQTFMIHGLTAAQLQNSKITLQRDGGYKAAWGKLETGMMM